MIHHQIHREGRADAPPVLLCNGLMMTVAAWLPLVAQLRVPGTIIGCDFRGQLFSPGEPHASFEGNARDVIDLLDELEIDQVHLVGTSFGAAVATMTAARYPERIRSLTALTAGDHPDRTLLEIEQQWRESCLAALNGGDARVFARQLFDAVYSRSFVETHRELLEARLEAVAGFPRAWYEGLLGLMASVRESDLRPELGKVRCATLVVAAADDRIIPGSRSRALAEGIRGARYELLADCGHGAVFEKPREIAALVSDFLGGSAAGGVIDE